MKKRRPGYWVQGGPAFERHPFSKLSPDDVLFIRKSKLNAAVLARQFGVTRQAIYKIRKRESYAWLTNEGTVSQKYSPPA